MPSKSTPPSKRAATQGNLPKRTVLSYKAIFNDRESQYSAYARETIEELVTKYGVPQIQLEIRINMFDFCSRFGTGRSWSERFAIDRPTAKRLVRRLRDDIEQLRKAFTQRFSYFLQAYGPDIVEPTLDMMERIAILIESSLTEVSDRVADWSLEPHRELTEWIWHTTKRPHDRLIADIVSAVLNRPYSYEEQAKFRARNCKRGRAGTLFPTA